MLVLLCRLLGLIGCRGTLLCVCVCLLTSRCGVESSNGHQAREAPGHKIYCRLPAKSSGCRQHTQSEAAHSSKIQHTAHNSWQNHSRNTPYSTHAGHRLRQQSQARHCGAVGRPSMPAPRLAAHTYREPNLKKSSGAAHQVQPPLERT